MDLLLGLGNPEHTEADPAVPRGHQPAGHHQHWHHRSRGPREKYRRQSAFRRTHSQVKLKASETVNVLQIQ